MKNFLIATSLILCVVLCAMIFVSCNNDVSGEPEAPSMDNPTNDVKEPNAIGLVPGSDGYAMVNMKDLPSYLETHKDCVILDVRTYDEFAEAHIPNAINIPNETIATDAVEILTDKEALIFVYCRSGNRSKEASKVLVELGYNNIVECGGIIDWQGETITENPIDLLLPLRLPMPDVLTYRFKLPRLGGGK